MLIGIPLSELRQKAVASVATPGESEETDDEDDNVNESVNVAIANTATKPSGTLKLTLGLMDDFHNCEEAVSTGSNESEWSQDFEGTMLAQEWLENCNLVAKDNKDDEKVCDWNDDESFASCCEWDDVD